MAPDDSIDRRDFLKTTSLGAGLPFGSVATGAVESEEDSFTAATDGVDVMLVSADSDAGFNYPYYLYAPGVAGENRRPLLVEPNNTGTPSDDFADHREKAESLIRNGTPRSISDELELPLLVPVFPRPKSDPEPVYVHALERATMELEDGPLERVDRQLVNMVDHAKQKLADASYPVHSGKILMNGFSASGNFTNRFAALHPEKVRAVTAGGINGTLVLPVSEDEGHTLEYHVGIANLDSLIGEQFDVEAWREVDQLAYMGGEDAKDTMPFDSLFPPDLREIALDVYGDHMQLERMPYCKAAYEQAGATGRVETYPNIGHRPVDEITAFHSKHAQPVSVGFADRPSFGSETVDIVANSWEDQDSYELRVFSDSRGELTESAVAFESGDNLATEVALTDAIDEGETVSVVVLEPGVTDAEKAVVDDEATAVGTVGFVEQPTAGETTVTVEYDISESYTEQESLSVRLDTEEGGAGEVADLEPGDADTVTVDVDEDVFGVPFVEGRDLDLVLVDDDPQGIEPVASSTASIATPDSTAVDITVDTDDVVEQGATASAKAAIFGLGGEAADLTITFEADESVVGTETVSISPGERAVATTSFQAANDQSGEFVVTASGGNATGEGTIVVATEPGTGNGSGDSPFEVSNGSELAYAAIEPDKQYELVDDIDLAGFTNFVRLGWKGAPFTGVFDGNGNTIRNLRLDVSTDQFDGVGLFGVIDEGTIKNVELTDVDVVGEEFTGGLVGTGVEDGSIANVSVSGNVVGTSNVGGIVGGVTTGDAETNGIDIVETVSRVTVEGESKVGGVIGQAAGNTIEKSYATGDVSATQIYAGGIIGASFFGTEIAESYTSSSISGEGGGLVGGEDELSTSAAYWDIEATGKDQSPGGGTGLTTAEMTGATATDSMDGFDFENTWDTTGEYPVLDWEAGFTFTSLSVPDQIATGETVTTAATVANESSNSLEETVEFRLGETVLDTREISLDPDGTATLEVTLDTSSFDIGAYEYTVGSGRAQQSADVQIVSDSTSLFEVTALDAPETISQETVSVTATITNLGVQDEQAVVIALYDQANEAVLSKQLSTLSLGTGEQATKSVELDTAEIQSGTYSLVVETEDDDRSTSVTITGLFVFNEIDTSNATDETEPKVTVTYSVDTDIDEKLNLDGTVSRLIVYDESKGENVDSSPLISAGDDNRSAEIPLEAPFSLEDEMIISPATSPPDFRTEFDEIADELREYAVTVSVCDLSPIDDICQVKFDAVLPDGADTSLTEVRGTVDKWADNQTIDGTEITLDTLQTIIDWWVSNR